ncbi:hypothetical protein [Archaeoglobus profundus]|uniref:Uncharacterized protein n=1 Tax=Archaeoglobus profundus (strain DSM 5631 / JCM 9629 / NBRC 100127 / Av18) TaxID=572546 RepID=D2RF97_ARCPA|nr:hypothetical protein [Archaeoglobus profundus]ADB58791.1 hypothetical protein Arcpr_1747 [Archaeoglobus profundus DSM 5631]
MRMELLYYNASRFSQIVSRVQGTIAEMKKHANGFERDCLNYVINRLTEIKCQMKFSRLLFDTGVKHVVVNDVDKIVRIGSEFKGIFELKVRRKNDRYIKINFAQLQTYRYLTNALGVPVYYLIFLPGNRYQLFEVGDFENEDFVAKYIDSPVKHLSDRFAIIDTRKHLIKSRDEVVQELHDILTIL